MYFDSSRYHMFPDLQQEKRVESCSYIIHHNADSFRQSFQPAQRKGLDDIEPSKEYKTGQQVFPIKWNTDQGDELSCYFVDDHKTRVFPAALSRYDCAWPDAKQGYSSA